MGKSGGFSTAGLEFRYLVEDSVHKPAGVRGAETLGQLDALVDRHLRRDLRMDDLIGRQPQDRAVHGIDPLGPWTKVIPMMALCLFIAATDARR